MYIDLNIAEIRLIEENILNTLKEFELPHKTIALIMATLQETQTPVEVNRVNVKSSNDIYGSYGAIGEM